MDSWGSLPQMGLRGRRLLERKSPWSKPITIKVVDSQVPPQRNRPVGIEPQQNGQVVSPSSRTDMGWPATISHEVKGTVRWEGAQPVRDATKGALPSQFANLYTISVTGFNLGYSSLSSSFLEQIRAATSLTKKDRSVTQAALVHGAGSAVLLGFSKRSIQLSPEDSEVEFATTISRMSIKTTVDFKEMMYHEALAI